MHISICNKRVCSLYIEQDRTNLFLARLILLANWMIENVRLPMRINLDKCGIGKTFVICPISADEMETEAHIFVHCTNFSNVKLEKLLLYVPFGTNFSNCGTRCKAYKSRVSLIQSRTLAGHTSLPNSLDTPF